MPSWNIIQAVNDALKLQMRKDPRVIVLGEDVGKFGGVFRATSGLFEEFGPDRVMDTPLAEAGIIGAAIGMALYGLKPICEMQFSGFAYQAFHQVEGHLSRFSTRTRGRSTTSSVMTPAIPATRKATTTDGTAGRPSPALAT